MWGLRRVPRIQILQMRLFEHVFADRLEAIANGLFEHVWVGRVVAVHPSLLQVRLGVRDRR